MADNQPKTQPKKSGEVQGEGDYKAARRYNEATREFVKEEDVAEAARDAEPQSAARAAANGARRAGGQRARKG